MVTLAHAPTASTDFEHWLGTLNTRWATDHREHLRQAHETALRCLPDSRTGLTAAGLLTSLRLDYEVVCAAILQEAVDRHQLSRSDIREQFGEGVAKLIKGVSRLELIGMLHQRGPQTPQQIEGLRKMLLAMAKDIRVVLIKLALRLCQMRDLDRLPETQRQAFAQETLDIFAPLANRLGIGQFKWELEDLSLRALDPDSYKTIARALDERRTDRERYIKKVLSELAKALRRSKLHSELSGRVKHIYSIWRKMQRKRLAFDQIFDVRAVRLLVPTLEDCYAALGVVHALWQNLPHEFDDYIAQPKENGYQSLHTAVIGPEGKTLEVQIRTLDMHHSAELGVAAHWRYKEGSKSQDSAFEQQIAWLRRLLELKNTDNSADEVIEYFKAEVFHDRVYVVTPRGDVLGLAQGATPLDFAYLVHTEVGHRCRGAKVNSRIVPLSYELANGDHVEIITAKTGGPNRNWLRPHLGYLKTSRARAKVRHWFRQQDREKIIMAGRTTLEQELQRLGLNLRQVDLDQLAVRFNGKKAEDLFLTIGNEELSSVSVINVLQDQLMPAPEQEFVPINRHRARQRDQAGNDVRILGVGNLLTQMAGCCKPVPYEPIIGFITQGRGVSIHRRDCANLVNLETFHQERFIEVEWGEEDNTAYAVELQIDAFDRTGLLRDITEILANERANVLAVNTLTDTSTLSANLTMTVEVADLAQLSRLMDRIGQLPNVFSVHRRHH